jgi:hypothetical protein
LISPFLSQDGALLSPQSQANRDGHKEVIATEWNNGIMEQWNNGRMGNRKKDS